jgi:predicted DNA-binding protein
VNAIAEATEQSLNNLLGTLTMLSCYLSARRTTRVDPLTIAPLYILSGYPIMISMKAVLLKLPDELVEAGDACADRLGVSRAEYIRRAIDRMNRETTRAQRAHDLMKASKKVRAESARVNVEFDAIETDVDS